MLFAWHILALQVGAGLGTHTWQPPVTGVSVCPGECVYVHVSLSGPVCLCTVWGPGKSARPRLGSHEHLCVLFFDNVDLCEDSVYFYESPHIEHRTQHTKETQEMLGYGQMGEGELVRVSRETTPIGYVSTERFIVRNCSWDDGACKSQDLWSATCRPSRARGLVPGLGSNT